MAGQEAATVQKGCCGRRPPPPSCDLLCTLHEPKGRGGACGFVLVFFRSPPQILYHVSGKLGLHQLVALSVPQPLLSARKKIHVLP